MVKQKCVRTYELYYDGRPYTTKNTCDELNNCLNDGWRVVMVTPKPDYNEYIIEKETKE